MTIVVVSLALIGHGHAYLVYVEVPVLGAGQADLVVPVPGGTPKVRWTGVVEIREHTGAVLEVIALEAGSAVSIIVVALALIRNNGTDLVGVEGSALRAGKADLVVPVPSGTTLVSGLCLIGERINTLSVLQVIALVA